MLLATGQLLVPHISLRNTIYCCVCGYTCYESVRVAPSLCMKYLSGKPNGCGATQRKGTTARGLGIVLHQGLFLYYYVVLTSPVWSAKRWPISTALGLIVPPLSCLVVVHVTHPSARFSNHSRDVELCWPSQVCVLLLS